MAGVLEIPATMDPHVPTRLMDQFAHVQLGLRDLFAAGPLIAVNWNPVGMEGHV